jgi:hypothetical protein
VQNAEQSAETLWGRISKHDQLAPIDRLYKEYSDHEFKHIRVDETQDPELAEFVKKVQERGPKFSVYDKDKLEYFAKRIYELRKN